MEVLQIKTFDKETCAKIYEAIGASCFKGDCHGLEEVYSFKFNEWVSVKNLSEDEPFDIFVTENGWNVPIPFVSHIRTITT